MFQAAGSHLSGGRRNDEVGAIASKGTSHRQPPIQTTSEDAR
jgi:hypothetical protein